MLNLDFLNDKTPFTELYLKIPNFIYFYTQTQQITEVVPYTCWYVKDGFNKTTSVVTKLIEQLGNFWTNLH